MKIPDLSKGLPKCVGAENCPNDGWIGTKMGFLCYPCLEKLNVFEAKKRVEEYADAFR
jgi:hypothetical protein